MELNTFADKLKALAQKPARLQEQLGHSQHGRPQLGQCLGQLPFVDAHPVFQEKDVVSIAKVVGLQCL
jgi:hypothetical protein